MLNLKKLLLIFLGGFFVSGWTSTAEATTMNQWSKVIPSVTWTDTSESLTRLGLSTLYPTGLYAKEGETITITGENINICLGPPGRADYNGKTAVTRYAVNGERVIQIKNKNSALYIQNESGMQQSVTISGGRQFPLFQKGITSTSDFFEELSSNSETPFIEFVGDYSILTIPDPKKYMEKLDIINKNDGFEQLIASFDTVVLNSAEAIGLNFKTSDSLNHMSGRVHYVKTDAFMNAGFFNANSDRVSLHNTSGFNNILGSFDGDPNKPPLLTGIWGLWGLWHETSHLFQNRYIMWDNKMSEVTVNIGTYYVMKKMSQPEVYGVPFRKVAGSVRTYLDTSGVEKNYDKKGDFYLKLGMFAQLMEAYGDDIFAKLNEEYRTQMFLGKLGSSDKYTIDGKKQLFMINISKVTKRNLSDFFEKWGVYPNEKSRKIMAEYAKPSVPIERNIFYGEKNYYDGENKTFENLSVKTKNITVSKLQNGLDALTPQDLFEPDSLYSFPKNEKLTLKSYNVTYKDTNYLMVQIQSEEGPSGIYKIPIDYSEDNDATYWGTVKWEFDESTGIVTLRGNGILGRESESPWNRSDDKKINAKAIKKIILNKPIEAPENSSGLFRRLDNLEEVINLSHLNTSKVTNMMEMFAYNGTIKKLDLSHFDTTNVMNYQGLFGQSPNIESLDISNFNINSKANLNYMFTTLIHLNELKLGKNSVFTTNSIGGNKSQEWVNVADPSTTMGTNWTLLKEYTGEYPGTYVWKENATNYKKITFVTNGGTPIEEQYILKGSQLLLPIPTKKEHSFVNWFQDDSLMIPYDTTRPITNDVILYAKWVENNVWGDVPWTFDSTNGTLTFKTKGTLGVAAKSPWNRTDSSKVAPSSIKKMVFKELVSAPADSTQLFSAFTGSLSNLTTIEGFQKISTNNVETMDGFFQNNTKLASVDISKMDTSKVTSMKQLFSNSGFKSLDVSSWETSSLKIMDGAFEKMAQLKTLDMSNVITSQATVEGLFTNDTTLEVLTLGTGFRDSKGTADLPDIQKESHYTGNWVNDSGIIGGTSSEFLMNYDGRHPGMYRWQRDEPVTSTVWAID